MNQFKICMIGAYAVGKTSLVEQYVHSLYSEKYQTTVGVKIDKKIMNVNSTDVTCMVWDIAGEDELHTVNNNYLRGMSGYLLVMDGTRRVSLEIAGKIQERIEVSFPRTPFVLVANKSDLQFEWTLRDEEIDKFSTWPFTYVQTSAKTGENVESAFRLLVEKMIDSQGVD